MTEKKKLQSFQVIKLMSSRLKEEGFRLSLSLPEARTNGEIIKLGENELISAIQRVTGTSTDFSTVEELEREKKKIERLRNSDRNRDAIRMFTADIDLLTFIPELIAVQFSDTRHYQNIVDQGLFLNSKKYVRLLAGAGNIRRNTVFFVDNSIYSPLIDILDNGRDVTVPLNPAKLSAYFGLYSSAGYPVSTPRFAVVPDYKFERVANLNWIDEEDNVATVEKTVEMNPFDGQGLVSPEWAGAWAFSVGVDYIPASFIMRASFTKGQVVTFDFKKFADEAGVERAVDIWGNSFSIAEQDIILSESQFKMGSSFKSCEEFVCNMKERGLEWRVSRYSPQFLRSATSSNYMILQVLDVEDNDIEELCKDTVKYFQDVEQDDNKKTALYMSGADTFTADFNADTFERLDIMSKAVLAYPKLLNEKYISQRILSTLKKRESQAQLGKLNFEGNYSPMVSDPYAQAEWLCGLDVKGLLAEGESYSAFWNDRGVDRVGCARSPLTHNSELRENKLVSGWAHEKWYEYLDTVFILTSLGIDTVFYSDGDFDGDILLSTSKTELMDCRIDGLPISYEHGLAEKKLVAPEDIYSGDMAGFNSKIGFITNVSSSYHSMLYNFPEGSPEYNEIQRRLKLLRMYQGENIDKAKNAGMSRDVPSHWTRWDKDSSPLDKKLVADKRPIFFINLYPSYMQKYKRELQTYNLNSWSRFGKPFEDLLVGKDNSPEEKKLVERYYKVSFFIFSDSPMNRISLYMTERLKEIKKKKRKFDFDYSDLLSSRDVVVDENLLKKMRTLFAKYSSAKKASRNQQNNYMKQDIFYILSEIGNEAREEISSCSVELGDLAVSLIIENKRARAFAFTVFGDSIIENVLNRHGRTISILVQDNFGEEEFLFESYSEKRIMV